MGSELEATDDQKSAFLQHFGELRPDFFLKEIYEDQAEREEAGLSVRTHSTRKTMFAAIPMKCKAEDCDFAETCPLQLKGIAPKGQKCPIELKMVADFMENMMFDLNVDPENMIEVSMVRDLVDQEIQHVRKSNLLAREDLIQENVIGLDDENRPIIKKELHLAVELEDKILKRKKDIRNQLLASRESRAKAGQSLVDTAQIISDKLEDLREIDLQRERLLRENGYSR
jgi:hypothetical protein